VVGLGGSLASPSRSFFALQVALEGARETGAQTDLLDLRDLDLPMFRPKLDAPEVVETMADKMHSAGGLIWSSPTYNGSMSGSMKNALDWLHVLARRDPPYLTDKVIGLISTAGGVQGLQTVNTMEFIVRALRGFAIPLVVPISRAHASIDEEGAVNDEGVESQLHSLGEEVGRVAGLFADGSRVQIECEAARERLGSQIAG
jgi:FMN reductase